MARIQLEQLWHKASEQVIIDVRTPAEYAAGHIPGAYNLPLFSNEERAIVGTLYKQHSADHAFLKGLDFVGPQMSTFVKKARKLAPAGQVLVHCWRGGQRSGSMAWLLGFAGLKVDILEGGYKAYRRFVLDEFTNRKLRFVVVGGQTGSGKTEILKALAEQGEQILDLEKIARHKGSAFGALGEAGQAQPEQFENDLFEGFNNLDTQRRIWLENESRAIGRVFLPQGFWDQFRESALVEVQLPLEERIRYLVEAYAQYPKQDLLQSFQSIERRLGGQWVKAAADALESDDYATAVQIALRYYDKSYPFANQKCQFNPVWKLSFDQINPHYIATELISFANGNNL
jgi:tRNA 2-selenouridine synthase